MADIVISCARAAAGWAGKLARALERHGYTVWWDRNLASGARYIQETEAQLRAAAATVVVWSKASHDSHWVADEAALARDLGRLAPISMDGTMPPLGFGQYQATDFSRWRGGEGEPLPALLKAIAGLAGDAAPKAMPAPQKRRSGLPLILGGGMLAVLVAALAIAWTSGVFNSQKEGVDASVAVLPFSDDSQASDQAHLANGMTGELLSRLRGIDDLTVAGGDWMPALIQQLSGDPKALGERLSVGHVLDGDIRSDGNRLRITARLTSATDGHLVWTDSYDRENSGIFAIQDEIARDVANALSVTLDVGLQSTSYGGTKNFEAYDHYLRGRALRNVPPPARAVSELERAVALDPNYARAWSELAIAYGTVVRLGRSPEEMAPALEKMDAASLKAEALAPQMWFGHTPRGWYFVATKSWTEADAAVRRALALGDVPDPEMYVTARNFENQVGRRTKVNQLVERTAAIDPRHPERDVNEMGVAFSEGDYARAWTAYDAFRQNAQTIAPAVDYNAIWLALADGNLDRADEILRRLAAMTPGYEEVRSRLRSPADLLAYVRSVGDQDSPGRGPLQFAAGLAGHIGEHELAVELLRKAYLGPGWAGHYQIWFPQFAEARKLPAFKDFVIDLGFVDMWRASGDWGDYCRPLGADDFECS